MLYTYGNIINEPREKGIKESMTTPSARLVRGGISMYAIVLTGGKQYKVAEGETIKVEKLDAEVGANVDL